MNLLITILLWFSAVTCGLMAGFYFAILAIVQR